MAIKVNQSNDGALEARTLFTGIAALQVVALNPTLAELKELGYSPKEEPVYVKTEQGITTTRLDFYLSGTHEPSGQTIKAKKSVWLRGQGCSTVFYINQFGNFSKDLENEKLQAGGTAEIREAYDGEVDLIQFLQNLCNTPKGESLTLDDRDALFLQGDITELDQAVKIAQGNQVKFLLGVREGKYQDVYGKWTGRSWANDFSYLYSLLKKDNDGGYLKLDYGSQLRFGGIYNSNMLFLREFTPAEQGGGTAPAAGVPAAGGPLAAAARPLSMPAARPGITPVRPAAAAAVAAPVGIGSDDDNDLPF